jgi:tetratricopeptide (TPR) repeat protein
MEIAKAQPTAENFAAALDTARQIDDSHQRVFALREIAEAQAQAENFAAALDTARQIDHSYDRAFALRKIAKAQPTAENFAAALDTARQIDHSYDRAEALFEIAEAQVQAKLSEQALLTAEKILINRNKHLPNIAAAFVETGDKENFKQLLIPCAYYLDAAYKMCGHLTKLYPNQATAVAEVVSTINKVNE